MNIAVGSDHAGFRLKAVIAAHLAERGHHALDLGTDSADSVDYPDYGAAVARAVVAGEADLGIAVCGSGIGICMAASKVPGARAACGAWRHVRPHVTVAQRRKRDVSGRTFTGEQVALDAVGAFLTTEFEGGRHQRRVDKIMALDVVTTTISEETH
ncbi:MAG: RpiB/LacA/LacB family sugar-phosphate isomerase [Acidimicrobiales bacterium]